MGFLFVGSVGVVPQWFTTRRSLANGIGASGSGFGGLTYSLATNALIENVGLAWAFRVLGIISFVVNSACAIILKDRNKQVGASQMAFDIRLFRRFEFWALLGFGVFSMLGYVVLIFSLPNYANSIGLTAKQASIVGAILNLGQGLGRPPMGYFSDVIGRINMAASMTVLSALFSFIVWINAKSFGVSIKEDHKTTKLTFNPGAHTLRIDWRSCRGNILGYCRTSHGGGRRIERITSSIIYHLGRSHFSNTV
jgi:MFS family permease